jgi:VCBS repeat-containing protein
VTLSVNPATLPPGITFNSATGTFSGTASPNASQGGPANNGVYPVVVTATDSNGATVTTVVTFTIANPPPEANTDTNSVPENTIATGNLLANDTDGGADTDPLTLTQINGAPFTPGATITLPSGALLVVNANGAYSYNPNGAFPNLSVGQVITDSFTYQVSDGQGGFTTATAYINMNGVNDPPIVINPANPGVPPADPMNVIPPQTGSDNTPITPISVAQYFTDADSNDTITFSIPPGTLPPGIVFDPVTGTFFGTPSPTASQGGPAGNGVYPIVITASDGNGGTVTTVITFNIGNPPPLAGDDVNATGEDGPPVTGNVMSNDADGANDNDPLTITRVNGSAFTSGTPITLPSGAVLTMNGDGTYSYNPGTAFNSLGAGQTRIDTFTYTISDGNGGTDTATVRITITGANDAPVVVNPANPGVPPADPNNVVPPVVGKDGSPIAHVNVGNFFRDPDAIDTLTFSVPPGSLPPGISFNPVTGVFSGTPGANASQGGPGGNGVYPIVVTASDGKGGVVTTIVTFTFTNPPPVAADDRGYTQPDTPLTLDVLGNDRDGGHDRDPLTITTATTLNGTVTINPNGTLTFKPDPDFVGLAEITYTISDGNGGFSTAKVFVLIAPNIHVTAPDSPIDTPKSDVSWPSNTGIDVQGAVVDAVNEAGYLDGVNPYLTVDGIIQLTANRISQLGGFADARTGIANATREPQDIHPLWRAGHFNEDRSTHGTMTWRPEGLTGFSLRSTFAIDSSSGAEAQVVMESLIRDRTLIVRLSSTEVPQHAHVVGYEVTSADGSPAPAWLDRIDAGVLMGQWPVDAEFLDLRVKAILSDGTTVERDVEIQLNSGEIQPLKLEKRTEVIPLFSDQLQRHAQQKDSEFDILIMALTG